MSEQPTSPEGGFVPAWVMQAVTYPTCPLCGEPVAVKGRTEHVICRMIENEREVSS